LSGKAIARIIVYGGTFGFILVYLSVTLYLNLRTYRIADFTEVDFNMTHAEVVELLGKPATGRLKLASNITTIGYNLNDGSKIQISFFTGYPINTFKIVDPTGRSFYLQRYVFNAFENSEIRKRENIYEVANFVNIEIGMLYAEVMNLLDISLENEHMLASIGITEIFTLGDGSEMRLSFNENDDLISIRIIDPIGRFFMTREEENDIVQTSACLQKNRQVC